MSATLQFLGAAGTVTGSKHLLRTDAAEVLLDCGLFQGLKALRLRNWQPLPLDVAALDAVVLSHGHVDHSGALPLLVRAGFRGPIHCTAPTADLLGIILRDAAHLQEEDAARANRRGYSKHRPALPLYDLADAERALACVRPHPWGTPVRVARGVDVVFHRAGHILGAAIVEVRLAEPPRCTLVHSGDLGRYARPILRDPTSLARADVLLVESTYGDRRHAPAPEDALAALVREVAAARRVLVVPAFAVGRTQEILWWLRELTARGRIPAVPVVIDSPMAAAVTALYARHPEEYDARVAAGAHDGDALAPPGLEIARTPEESKALNARSGPLVVLSASGMATGGRVLHHLAHRLPDPEAVVLLCGFQAAGTRGRSLQDGAETVRIHGADVRVRARVVVLDGLSAHADRDELLRWASGFAPPPRQTWVVHGEPQAADRLAAALRTRGWTAAVAGDREVVSLPGPAAARA